MISESLGFLTKGGEFQITCVDGITGEVKWEEIAKNTVLTVGQTLALDILFDGSTSKVTTWNLGVSNDTTTITPSYTLTGEIGTRQATTFTLVSGTATTAQEAFTGITSTVQKAFLVTASTGGTVFAISNLSTPRTLVSSDVLNIIYSIQIS